MDTPADHPDRYLFMHPSSLSQAFFDPYHREEGRDSIEALFDMVDARYRQQGYHVNWALFEDSTTGLPDRERVPEYADIREEDRVLAVDVSYPELNEDGLYPDPDPLLDTMVPGDELVIGGFHLYDCVERVAERAWERGLEPFVDEETTEAFFGSYRQGEMPLVREDWSLTALGFDDADIPWIREKRAEKPWLPP